MSLRAEALCRRYATGGGLHPLTLRIEQGTQVALIGPNGAGKSTAFRLLAGQERADAGRVWLGDRELTALPLHRRVRAGLGYLPQEASVLPRLTARANLALGLSRSERHTAGERLAAAGLASIADRRAGSLSGGERRRLELERTLALGPRAVLLDEPFAGVDPVAVMALRERLRRAVAAGVALLWTDHRVQIALDDCDEVIVLREGGVIARGPPAVIARDAAARSTLLDAR